MVEEYEKALRCLSSLRTRADGSNKGDRFDLMFDYVKILDLEDAVSQLKIIHVAGTKGKGPTRSPNLFCGVVDFGQGYSHLLI